MTLPLFRLSHYQPHHKFLDCKKIVPNSDRNHNQGKCVGSLQGNYVDRLMGAHGVGGRQTRLIRRDVAWAKQYTAT